MADYTGWIDDEKQVAKVCEYLEGADIEVGIATYRDQRVITLDGPMCINEGQVDFYSLEEARSLVHALQEAIFELEKEQSNATLERV